MEHPFFTQSIPHYFCTDKKKGLSFSSQVAHGAGLRWKEGCTNIWISAKPGIKLGILLLEGRNFTNCANHAAQNKQFLLTKWVCLKASSVSNILKSFTHVYRSSGITDILFGLRRCHLLFMNVFIWGPLVYQFIRAFRMFWSKRLLQKSKRL